MASDKLALLINKEEKNLKKLREKKIEIEEKIKIAESNLEKYTMMQNNEKFTELSKVVQASGLDVEDVLLALKSGNLLSLQQQIKQTSENSDEEAWGREE